MAQPATNPKIEELRFRLKADPKSRLFYQLAEELRRAGQSAEAEQVLRNGLGAYPTYLAAWVSLGRVLRDQRNDAAAIEVLTKAMQLDPGNVVAARLLADAYRALGDNLEALKKYKLVHALMPGDEELKQTIEQLERELNPPPVVDGTPAEQPMPVTRAAEAVAAPSEPEPSPLALEPIEESPFDRTIPPFADVNLGEADTGDVEPMLLAHDESPFEEPAPAATAATMEIEHPAGMHIEEAPAVAEVPAAVSLVESESMFESPEPEPLVFAEEEALPEPQPAAFAMEETDPESAAAVFAEEEASSAPEPVFAEAASPEPASHEEPTETSTMADLYARQGLLNEARHIYENILARDPGNVDIRARLDAITPRVNPRIDRLERWLAKVGRKEVGRV